MRCALRRLLRGESDDVAPVGDVARAPPPESTPAFAYRHLAEEPVAATLLPHREVVDRAGHLRRRESDGAVEELTDDQPLGRPLREPAHVQHAGRDDLAPGEGCHAGHRKEDATPAENLHDQPEDPRVGRPDGDDHVAQLAHLVAGGVIDGLADESGQEDPRRRRRPGWRRHNHRAYSRMGWKRVTRAHQSGSGRGPTNVLRYMSARCSARRSWGHCRSWMSASIRSEEISANSMSVAVSTLQPVASRWSWSNHSARRRQFRICAVKTRSRWAAASASRSRASMIARSTVSSRGW